MAEPQVPNRVLDQYLLDALNYYKSVSPGVRSTFGYDYTQGAINDQSIRAALYPQPGESYEAWLKRVDRDHPGFADVLGGQGESSIWSSHQAPRSHAQSTIKKFLETDDANLSPEERAAKQKLLSLRGNLNQFRNDVGFADPNKLGGTEQIGGMSADQQSQQAGTDLMRRFAASLLQPLDQNDPYVKALTQQTSAAASRDASNRGIRGGLAVGNTEAAVGNVLNQAQMQRQGLGVQALGAAEGIDLQKAQLAQQAYNQQYAAQMGQLQNSYQQRMAQNQGVWGTIGAVGGGLAGAYFGGPQGAQVGAQVGSQFLGGLGGLSTGSAPSMPYNPPALGGSRGLGGY